MSTEINIDRYHRLLAACQAVDADIELIGRVSEESVEMVRQVVAENAGRPPTIVDDLANALTGLLAVSGPLEQDSEIARMARRAGRDALAKIGRQP